MPCGTGKSLLAFWIAEALKAKSVIVSIGLGIISDYKIVTYSVTMSELNELIKSNRLLNLGHDLEEAQAQDIAANIAVKSVMKQYGVKHALVFNRSIRAAKDFCEVQDVLNFLGIGPYAANFHVNGAMSAGVRKQRLDEFKETTASPALMTNARCLTEGVDVPGIDCVMFAAPKQSVIDIVQASGRAMRKAKGKQYGYLVIPIVVPDGKRFDEFAETTTFRKVVSIISALSTQDSRIVEELKAMYCGPTPKARKPREGILKFGGTIPVGFKMDIKLFADTIAAKVWDRVGAINLLPFKDARAIARTLGLNSKEEWEAFSKTDKKPRDIPANPPGVYKDEWISWPDWMGYESAPEFWPFRKARAYMHEVGLETYYDWQKYRESKKRPVQIPKYPNAVYKAEWINWSDFLGTGARNWLPFLEARAKVHKLRITSSQEWQRRCKSKKVPRNIPANPVSVYAKEWKGWGDWLGTRSRRGGWRPYKDARDNYARKLGFKNRQPGRRKSLGSAPVRPVHAFEVCSVRGMRALKHVIEK